MIFTTNNAAKNVNKKKTKIIEYTIRFRAHDITRNPRNF